MTIEAISKAIGDESRRKIIEMLKDGEMPASSIFDQFDYAAPTISRHLSVLKEAGIVNTRRNGVFIYYTLNTDVLGQLANWLSPLLPSTVQTQKVAPKERAIRVPKLKAENPFDKFQSEF
jgi:DNA-binding transcriptional ArsR family regulator